MQLTENEGFCDMLIMVAHPQVLEFSESLLAFNGCLNFFAGPTDQQFSAKINTFKSNYSIPVHDAESEPGDRVCSLRYKGC